jgi:glycosyltransferase involved in cell wall biosynthesis
MLVSVIIPTYNRAKTIERAVNSVLAQTWKKTEVIVVDDGSTDQTDEILKAFGDKIHVICQQNRGPGAARNAGIQEAKGEIISFLDSDDEWLPDKTERQVKLLQATESAGVKCCVCNAKMVFSSETLTSFASADLHPRPQEGIWLNPADVLITRFLLFNQVVAVRREALEETGYFLQGNNVCKNLLEDYDLALRLSLIGPWAYIADPMVVYHGDTKDSISQGATQLETHRRTLEILVNTGNSPKFGPLLPQKLLHRRIRVLTQRIAALRLLAQPSRTTRLYAKLQLWYLRGGQAIYWRLPSTPRMMTRAV